MPICIILDPWNPLIHIEGGGGRDRLRAPQGAPAQEGAAESGPVLPKGSAPPPRAACLAGEGRPPRAGSAGRAARVGRGVRLGPGMSTSHII